MKTTLRFIGSFVFIFFLLTLLFSYAMFQGGFVSWFLFYSFLPIFLYHLSFLFYPIRNWNVSRSLSDHAVHSGDSILVTIKIKRKLPFPLYYCVFEDVIPVSLNKIDNRHRKFNHMHDPKKLLIKRQMKKVSFPWFKRNFELKYELDHVPRGEHVFNTIRIKTGDVFGFITKEHTFELIDELIVYPGTRSILLNDRLNSLTQGTSASLAFNRKQTNIASGIREYYPGDKMSWIHWKQTARKNKIITKEFEQERSTDTLIVIDRCDYQGMNDLAFEGIIEVVIALIETLKKRTARFELLSIGADAQHFPYQQNILIDESINQHLTRINPSLDKPFALKLKEEILRYQANLNTLIVTTRIDVGLVQTLKQINQRHKSITLFFIQATKENALEHGNLIKQLRYLGVTVYKIGQNELIKNPIEVIV